uniref:Disintegrin and metalloproteinase domain-containing protein 10-like isoform X2 n=1 Tax=Castor canadensis TaxID=51338 RepID=A0A8B7V0U3_CASCN|nr:disintegrin and metalloproteinase domain-containing protein 10-like isoform X2 [Castor canadensis]
MSFLLPLIGEEGSFSHGSVIDGRFEGFIKTRGGTFYVEPAERYIKDRILPFHSVIYHEDDISQYGNPLNKYIRHYEGLSYNVDSLHQKHQRAKRAVSHEDQFLRLDFHAHGRHFNLRMKRDTSLFSDEFKVETSNKVLDYDTSHIYTGHIYGKLKLHRTLFFIFFLHKEM